MKDKDTLILESLYSLVVEGLSEAEKKLKDMDISDEDIQKLINVDVTKQKSDAVKMGEFISTSDMSVDNMIKLYSEFVKFKNKGASEARDFQAYKSLKDLEKVLVKLNSQEVEKLLKDSEDAKKLLNLDKSLGKRDSGIIARWVKDLKGRIPNSEVIAEYEKFLRYQEQGIEGASDLGIYKKFYDFAEFIHNEEAKNAKQEEKQNVTVGYDPIYEDDEIAIWDIDNVGKSINIGHSVSRKIGGTQITWCISTPLNAGITNYFSSYRQGKVGSSIPLSFYFVWSKKMEQQKNDDYSFSAVAIRKDGEFEITPRPNGTKQRSWEEIVSLIPALKNHKDVFKYKPLTDDEVRRMRLFDNLGRNFNEEDFLKLDDKDQYEYISYGEDIPVTTFLKLSKERKNDYLNILAQSQTRDPSKKLLNVLTPEQLDRMESTRFRAIEYKLTGVNAPLAL
jgi:hypothetical protein